MMLQKSFEWLSPFDEQTLDGLFREGVVSVCINKQREVTASIYRQDYQSMLPRRWLRTEALDLVMRMLLEEENQEIMKICASRGQFDENQHRDYIKLVDAFVVTLLMVNEQEVILKSLQPLGLFSAKTKYLCFPLNTENVQGAHWVFGLFRNGGFQGKDEESRLWIFDSAQSGSVVGKGLKLRLQNLFKVLNEKQIKIDLRIVEDIPRQNNGYDCGVYAIAFCEYAMKEVVNELQEKAEIRLDRLNKSFKYLFYNSSSSRQRYRRMLERNLFEYVI